jgi:hypothetical protein
MHKIQEKEILESMKFKPNWNCKKNKGKRKQ